MFTCCLTVPLKNAIWWGVWLSFSWTSLVWSSKQIKKQKLLINILERLYEKTYLAQGEQHSGDSKDLPTKPLNVTLHVSIKSFWGDLMIKMINSGYRGPISCPSWGHYVMFLDETFPYCLSPPRGKWYGFLWTFRET